MSAWEPKGNSLKSSFEYPEFQILLMELKIKITSSKYLTHTQTKFFNKIETANRKLPIVMFGLVQHFLRVKMLLPRFILFTTSVRNGLLFTSIVLKDLAGS